MLLETGVARAIISRARYFYLTNRSASGASVFHGPAGNSLKSLSTKLTLASPRRIDHAPRDSASAHSSAVRLAGRAARPVGGFFRFHRNSVATSVLHLQKVSQPGESEGCRSNASCSHFPEPTGALGA